jgi:hypothetical protein
MMLNDVAEHRIASQGGPRTEAMPILAEQLTPLPYHTELRDYLKSQERDLWSYFASAKARTEFTEKIRVDLLKSAYRLDPDAHADLATIAQEVKDALQLDVPVTLYQAQQISELNATLYYIPGEGHVVFSGPVLTLLGADELKSVIGHELAHFLLWEREEGEFQIADRVIGAAASDPRATRSHEQTARRYQLYTEIFADRGSLLATGDLHAVVGGLVKIQTGLQTASAASYLKQADEIFARGNVTTLEVSHPEAFIRTRALSLWASGREDSAALLAAMIEGSDALGELDLISQQRLTSATWKLLQQFLQPRWFQTESVLGHAKLFFADFQPAPARDPGDLKEPIFADPRFREYFAYVLLDFIIADPSLDETPLAAALDLAGKLGWNSQFDKMVARELKIKARDVKRVKEQAAQLLAKAEVNGE